MSKLHKLLTYENFLFLIGFAYFVLKFWCKPSNTDRTLEIKLTKGNEKLRKENKKLKKTVKNLTKYVQNFDSNKPNIVLPILETEKFRETAPAGWIAVNASLEKRQKKNKRRIETYFCESK